MVWGLVDPSGFGDFLPGGDYVGWHKQIEKYFDEEMTPEQRAAFDNWDVNFRGEVARKFTGDAGELKPHECPTEFRIRENRKSLGSLIEMNSRLLAVDEALKNIIEKMEPGVHQFREIKITLPKDIGYPCPYYILVIRQFFASFLPEESKNYRSSPDVGFFFANGDTKHCYANLTISQAVVAGAHLWRERKLRSPEILLSDELQAEIARQRLRIPKHHRMKAIPS